MMILSLRKPIVLIDVTRSPQSGIGTYSWNLLRHLQQSTRGYTFLGLTKPQHEAYARANGLNTIIFPREPRTPTEILQLSHLISKSADIYIATGFTQMVFPRIPVIQVVHDLIYMSHPEWQPTQEDFQVSHGKAVIRAVRYGLLPLFRLLVRRYYGRWRRALGYSPLADLFVLGVSYQILRAKAIVTVSNTTREEVLKRYDLSEPLRTIYPIIPYSAKTVEAGSPGSTLHILYIANFEPRKNHCVAFEAVAALPDELRRKTRLILVGKSAYNSHEQAFRRHLSRFGERIQVEIYQGIPEDEKEHLFARSALLLFPSLAEGFGIPLLEAMQRGLPIIAYETPIAREICGDGARYVGANRGAAFAEAIVEMYKNGAHAMRPAQQRQVRKFANSQADETMTGLLQKIL